MSNDTFEKKREKGRRWEDALTKALLSVGANVTPLYEMNSNGAPEMVASDGRRLTLPDIHAHINGKPIYIEVKY